MTFMPRSLLVFILTFASLEFASAQPAIDRPLDSNLKAGQLFTVRIAPAGKKIEVFVAGHDAASVDFSDLNLVATVKVGTKRWSVVPERKSDHFVLTRPADFPPKSKAELRLFLNSKEKEETMSFDLKPID